MYNLYAYTGNNKKTLHEADTNSKIKVTGTYKASINTSDSLTFTMPYGNPCYDFIVPRKTVIEMYDAKTGTRIFRGTVLKPTSQMETDGKVSKTYVCAGELDYLSDTVQPYQQVTGIANFFEAVLNTHNSQVVDSKKIYKGTITGSAPTRSRTWHYVSSFRAIADYIKDYGGEIKLRYGQDGKRYLDYTSTVFSSGSSTKIELAVNMQSVSFTVDPTAIASGVYPVGAKLHDDGTSAERLEYGSVVWNANLRAKYGDIVTVVTWDDVTVKANLYNKAVQWLANQAGELHQYSVNAVELSRINSSFDEFAVGVQYAIKNPLIGLDDVVRCISKSIDINDPTKATMTFGDKYETLQAVLTNRLSTLDTKIDKVADEITTTQEEFVRNVVANQTALLTGAEGGYVYQHLNSAGKPQEIFFLNSPDIDTATQAIRINQNGIGFWKASAQTPPGSAMTGPYKNAWTIDGTFNTDYIVGRNITGFTFDNGDGTFKVNANGSVTAKALTITNGSINCGNGKFTVDSAGNVVANSLSSNNATITGGSINIVTTSQADDRIRLAYNEWEALIMPLQLSLENTTDDNEMIAQAGGVFFKHGNKTRAVLSQAGLTLYGTNGTTVVAQLNSSGDLIVSGDVSVGGNIIIDEGSTITFDDAWLRYPGGTLASLKNLLST